MEKTTKGTVVGVQAGVILLGICLKNSIKDENGNSIKGSMITNSEGCYLRSETRLVVG